MHTMQPDPHTRPWGWVEIPSVSEILTPQKEFAFQHPCFLQDVYDQRLSFLTGQKDVRKEGLRLRRTSFDSTAVIDEMEHFLVPHPRLPNDKLEALDPLCFGKPLDISDVPQSSRTSPLRQAHLEALMCK